MKKELKKVVFALSMKRFRMQMLLLILGFTVLLPSAIQADNRIKPGEETFAISAGVFLPKIDSKISADNDILGIGDIIDLEDDLDLDENNNTFWGSAYWRFKPKHRLSVGYYQMKRNASATAKTDLIIGDEIYPAGASLSTEFSMQVLPITYSYSFMKREKFEFGMSFGLHWNTVNFEVQGSASLGGQDANASVTAKALAPMPLLGLWYDYHFTPKFSAGVHGEVFALDISDDTFAFSGTITNLRLSTEYWFFNNVALGAALNWFALDVDVEDSEWKGTLDYEYFGPQIYLKARF